MRTSTIRFLSLSTLCHRRQKGGPRVWMPEFLFNRNGGHITRDEVKGIITKPLPAAHTVDSEEDYYDNCMLMREYYGPQAKTSPNPDYAPLAHSSSEMRSMMDRLAEQKQQDAKSAERGQDPSAKVEKDIAFSPSDIEEQLGPVSGVQYEMDDYRREIIEKLNAVIAQYDALVESAALAEGCQTEEGRQGWLATFFGVHDEGLEKLGERVTNLQSDAQELSDDAAMTMSEEEAKEGPLPAEYVEYAPVYKAYLQYCRGESKTPYCTMGDLGETGLLAAYHERVRWRKIFDKISEALKAAKRKIPLKRDGNFYDYLDTVELSFTEAEKPDVHRLNHQLKTLRLFDAKKVEIQRELVTRVNLGAGGSAQHEHFGAKRSNMPESLKNQPGV